MRKTYFFMAFWALAFGISGCGDITCEEGESFCSDEKTIMRCEKGVIKSSTCTNGCNTSTGKCKACIEGASFCFDDTTMMRCKRGELTFSYCSSGCNFDTGKCKGSSDSPDKGSSDSPEEYAPCSIPNTVAHKAACAPLGESKTATCIADYVFDCDSLLCGIYNSSSPFCTYRCIPTKEECEAAVSDEKKCTPEGDSKGISYVKCPEGYDCITECPNGAACVEWTSGTGGFFCLPADKKGIGAECTSGSYKCADNYNLYSCKDGHWGPEKYCANGCNTSTGKCNANNGGNDNSGGGNNGSTPECTSGSYKCVDDISYYCDYGWWGTYDYCSNGCNTFTGKCNVVEDGMAAECTSGSYKCENDTSYYCNYGWWAVEEYCEYGCDMNSGRCHTSGTTDSTPDDGSAIANWTSFSNGLKKADVVAGIPAGEGSADTTAKLTWVGNNKDGSIGISVDNNRLRFTSNEQGGKGAVATDNSYLRISYATLSSRATLTLKIETRGSIYVFTDANDRKLNSTPTEITSNANNPAEFTVTLPALSTSVRLYNAVPTSKAVYISSIVIQ